jgi:Sec-independent protein secretion pathway component TatC
VLNYISFGEEIRMSPFFWRIIGTMFVVFLIFSISVIAVTLVLVNEVRADTVDDTKLLFVEVSNWILIAFYVSFIVTILASTPFIVKYTHLPMDIDSTGLHKATPKK